MSKPVDLTLKLALGGGVILLPLAIALVGGLLVFSDAIGRADQSVADLNAIRRVFDAGRAIGVERTQSARMLIGRSAAPAGGTEPIETVRDRVDHAIAVLVALDTSGGGLAEDPAFTVNIAQLRASLAKARTSFDQLRVADHPIAATALTRSFGEFSDAAEAARSASERIVLRFGARQVMTAPLALTALSLGDLSDAILDMGLDVAPTLDTHQPLVAADRASYGRLRERLTQSWQTAVRDMSVDGDVPAVTTARNQVAAHLWHDTIDVIDRAFDFGQLSGDYRVTAGDLVDASDATSLLVDRLRSVVIDQAAQKILTRRDDFALWRIGYLAFFTLALAASAAVIGFVWVRVLSPLFVAGHRIKALARLEPVGTVMSPTGQPEIATIFEAVEDLFIVLEERAEHTQQLKQLAETDGLTGLMNRRLLDRIGEGAIEFDSLPRAVSVILMDLDRFKSINDSYGHTSGDLVLRHAARLAQRVCRKSDLVARYGGEEMAIVIFDQDDWVAPHVAERVRSELEAAPVRLEDGRLLTVTASFGVAHGRRGGPQWLDVLNGADEALYRAKAGGRNRVCAHGVEAAANRQVA